MKNSIVVSTEFFFKGRKISPSMQLDLDAHLRNQSSIESLPPLLAKNNNIDLYSYEYEILLTEPLVFSNATGLAEKFLHDGKFDFDAFSQAWQEAQITELVAGIAQKHLAVADLAAQPELQAALIAAYRLGRQS